MGSDVALGAQQLRHEDSAACRAPVFGTGLPQSESLRAEDGRLERADTGGTARYSLTLRAEYEWTPQP